MSASCPTSNLLFNQSAVPVHNTCLTVRAPIQTRIAYFEETVVRKSDDMIPENWLKIGSENYKILLT
jgi:hypothetical protein